MSPSEDSSMLQNSKSKCHQFPKQVSVNCTIFLVDIDSTLGILNHEGPKMNTHIPTILVFFLLGPALSMRKNHEKMYFFS